MNQDTYNLILEECKQFRLSIEECKNKIGLDWFKDFPNGCCGDTALLLGKYLHEKGFGIPYYVSGWMGKKSHAWLELDGLIIDITADQFENISETVIVVRESDFHEEFKEVEKVLYNVLFSGENFGDFDLLNAFFIISKTIREAH